MKKKAKKKIQKCKKEKCSLFLASGGFTLFELLASLTIFSLIIGAASGMFILTIRAQRKLLASQKLLSQTSYLMEYMSRAIRMAKKDIAGECIDEKLNYKITYSGQGIRFMNYNGICQEFYLSDFQLKEQKSKGWSILSNLTSDDLQVLSFNIGPEDSWSQDDSEQPRVTLFLEIQGVGQKPELQPKIKIQTTISQRNLDVKY